MRPQAEDARAPDRWTPSSDLTVRTCTPSTTRTIGDCVSDARQRLPRLEADLLASCALGVRRSDLYAFPERPVAPSAAVRAADWTSRRNRGEPVAYILGTREFWGLGLAVSPAVLIPRHDTETLVEQALPRVQDDSRVLDIGTGCGALALAIAAERPRARVVASDIDPACLDLARCNAQRLGLRIDLIEADLFAGIGRIFDVIVSNPPYVAPGDVHLSTGDLRFEPRAALVAGEDGMGIIDRLIASAPAHLEVDGWLYVEHGLAQADAVRARLHSAGFVDVSTACDLAGQPRVSGGRRPRHVP